MLILPFKLNQELPAKSMQTVVVNKGFFQAPAPGGYCWGLFLFINDQVAGNKYILKGLGISGLSGSSAF